MIVLEQIDKYQIISFDIFGTLILRNVASPKDVFEIVERKCKEQNVPCPSRFVELRIDADKRAQELYHGCATIDEIYNQFEKIDHRVKDVEIEVEYDICTPNKRIVDLFHQCISKGKRVIIVSDMYLSSYSLNRMLEKCGITGYSKLYVSCETRACKGTGELFTLVKREEVVNKEKIIHIGDNCLGDFIRPTSKGIHSTLLKCKHIDKVGDITDSIINSTIINISNNMNYAQALGCKNFGLLLLGFIKWLNKSMIEDEIEQVFFLARDGYIIQKAFKLLYEETWKSKMNYMFCSRRAFSVPLIWKDPELDNVRKLIPFPHRMSLSQFITRVGLEENEISETLSAYSNVKDTVFDHCQLFDQAFFLDFYNGIKDAMIENSKREFDALSKYITSFDIQKKIAIVDIGYHGTMQNAFEKALKELGITTSVTGYYVDIASDDSPITRHNLSAKGFLNEMDDSCKIYNKIQLFVPLFELAFSAPHGSTKKFMIDDNGNSNPFLYEYEYKDAQSDDLVKIANYQAGAIELISEIKKSKTEKILDISSEMASREYVKMGTEPDMKVATFWGDMGFFEYTAQPIANPKSLFYYLLDIRKFKNDLLSSQWKIGFLKRLFKARLPYEQIINTLRKSYNNI